MSSKPLLLRDLNEYLLCKLCFGYLIDATTITECLHSFCKSCIVKYLEGSNFCPACDVQVHKAKPLMHIRPDRTRQDLVYKLVPELFRSEMARRKEFYSKHPETGSIPEGVICSRMLFFSPNDQISLSVEYIDSSHGGISEDKEMKSNISDADLTENGKKVLGKRFLSCPAGMTIGHLHKFIRLKYDLEHRYKVDILCHSELLLPEYRLLDVAYITSWTQEEPLRLYYRIYQIKRHNIIAETSPRDIESHENEGTKRSKKESPSTSSEVPPGLVPIKADLNETCGVKRHLSDTSKAKMQTGVNGLSKKARLEDISQSARLKLIAKAKSEKLDEYQEGEAITEYQNLSVPVKSDKLGQLWDIPAVKFNLKSGNWNSLKVKSTRKNRTKKVSKIDFDSKPLQPDNVSLPSIASFGPKPPSKSPVKLKVGCVTESEEAIIEDKRTRNCPNNILDMKENSTNCSVKVAVTNSTNEMTISIPQTARKVPELRKIEQSREDSQYGTPKTDISTHNVLLKQTKDKTKTNGNDVNKDEKLNMTNGTTYDIKGSAFTVSPENKTNTDNSSHSKSDSSDGDSSSKKRKASSNGPAKTMPNLIAISEIPTPLIARSMQTIASNKKPAVKIMEAAKRSEPGKMALKEDSDSTQVTAVILDLSGKSSTSTSRSSSVSAMEDRKSPSPPAKRSTPTLSAVSITEKPSTAKPSTDIHSNKELTQPRHFQLPEHGNINTFTNHAMNIQHQNMAQNQLFQSMALAQRQQMQQLQAAMYAASAAKQAIGTTSPLTNRAEFERMRNMLTWNALAQLQSQRTPTAQQESCRLSSSSSSDGSQASMMTKLPNVTKAKNPTFKSNNDPVNVNIRHFVQSQQNCRSATSPSPRMGLNSSVREIPNPSLLQQRRLTQLLSAGVSQGRDTVATSNAPVPKRIMETKLASNKELTVSIVNPENKARKFSEVKNE
ncbi:hypothetical protein QYM36_008436 [Artemia franciscana]|nr:hypothetical protein QYM36_008436 [Artemia franciscana]